MGATRRGLISATAGLGVLALAGCSPTAARSQAGYDSGSPQARQWNLSTDFLNSPTSNPAPDSTGGAGVWTWAEQVPAGAAPRGLPTSTAGYCGAAAATTAWTDAGTGATLVASVPPAVCAPAGGAAFAVMSGQVNALPTPAAPVEVRWTSPVSGTVVITGGLVPTTDPSIGGQPATPPTYVPVGWRISSGSTTFASGTTTGGQEAFNPADDAAYAAFNSGAGTAVPALQGVPVQVTAGQVLDLVVTATAASTATSSDATELDYTINYGPPGPTAALPESRVAWALPLSGAAVAAAGLGIRRRRRRSATAR